MSKIIVTEDLRSCPNCEAPAVNTGCRSRICNTCGMAWEVMTAEDELDAEADAVVRGREWNEEKGRAKRIGKFQTRW